MKRTSYNCKQNKKVATDRNSDWYRKNKDVMDRTGTICLATGHQRSLRTNNY